MSTTMVKLGDHHLPVVPQRHARLRHQLSAADLNNILSKDYGHEAYRVLSVLIPELSRQMPEWEFEGYGSQEAMEAGEYVEQADRSPTTAEIAAAFETAWNVSGAGRLAGKLGPLVQLLAKNQNPTPTETPVSAPSSQNGEPTLASPASAGTSGESD